MSDISPEIVDLLAELLDYRENWFKLCKYFKVSPDDRRAFYKADQMIERINTYLTSYVGRRSIDERESGAAFRDPTPTPLPDPEKPVDKP